jgi:hypothetical protein
MLSSPICFFKQLKYLFHSQICYVFNWSTREFIHCVNGAPPCIPHTSSDWLLSGGQKKRKIWLLFHQTEVIIWNLFLAATVQMDYDWPSTGLNNSPTLSNKYKTCTWIRSVVQHLIVLKLNYLFLARVRVSPWECTACPASCLFMVVVTVPEDTQLW